MRTSRGFASLALTLLIVLALAAIGGAGWWLGRHEASAPALTPGSPATTTPPVPRALTLKPVTVALANGKTFTLDIPSDYSLTVAAQGFRAARFMAWSPDHRLFIGELTSASDTHTGRVLVLDGFDPTAGTFASVHTYLDNQRNPNSIAFYRDREGREWLYVALTDKLVRYSYRAGDNAPSGAPETLAPFPDFGPPPSQGGWHLTRTLAFNGDTLYVSVGSGCNSCEEVGVARADILEMDPDGSNAHVYASGLRNAVGIVYATGALYATANEADHLGNDKPNDLVYRIQGGANYGWPYCYEHDGVVYADTTQAWRTQYDCAKVPLAFADLAPHSAPLGLAYFDDMFADPALRGAFLVAEHGSGKPSIATGYQVSIVRKGAAIAFVTGFLSNGTRQGRPVDILINDDHSFFVTDDLNGAVYYLRYNP